MVDERQWRVGADGAVVHQGRVLLVRHMYGDKKGRWALHGGDGLAEDERFPDKRRDVPGFSGEV